MIVKKNRQDMIKCHYIDGIKGGQIHFARNGKTETEFPTIFFIHQTPRSWDEYREVLGLLSGKLNCFAIDLPGMGNSSPVSNKPTIELYADCVMQVIDHAIQGDNHATQEFIICGHHTGGVVAMEIASRIANQLHSLILSSTPWVDEKARLLRAKKTPIDFFEPSRDGYHLLDLWRQRSDFYPTKVQYMDRFITSALQAERAVEGHYAVGNYKMENIVSQIVCPTLIIEHMKDPFAVRYTNALQNVLPHAELEYIPDGGIPLEATASRFVEIILRWTLPVDKKPARRKLRIIK